MLRLTGFPGGKKKVGMRPIPSTNIEPEKMNAQTRNKVVLDCLAMAAVVFAAVAMAAEGCPSCMVAITAAVACLCLVGRMLVLALSMEVGNEEKLLKHLPRVGFDVESIEREEDGSAVRITGRYRDEPMAIDAFARSAYVRIFDWPWLRIAGGDPATQKVLEAMNTTNLNCVPTIVCTHPGDDGFRYVHTQFETIVPRTHVGEFLRGALDFVLEARLDMRENYVDYPWLQAKAMRPVGFATGGRAVTPAARDDSPVRETMDGNE